MVCSLHIHYVSCRRCSAALVKSLVSSYKFGSKPNSLFSLDSQFPQETVSLIIPIVAVMANSPRPQLTMPSITRIASVSSHKYI